MRVFWFRPSLAVGLFFGFLLVFVFLAISISSGTTGITLRTVYDSFTQFDGSREHLIVQTVRVPRALVTMMVGCCLAVSGAMMQALTRNPLAAPEILGINHGAALFVVLALFILDGSSLFAYTWFAFIGAGLAAIVVYMIGSMGRSGLSPLKLTLAGVAITTILASLTQGFLILNQRSLDEMRFWLAGSVTGRDLEIFLQVLPYMIIGLISALLLSKQLTVLSMGEDVARGIGQNTLRVKILALASIVFLAGSSVALAGPIGFVGLAIPHIVRALVGTDYRWILPYSAAVGAILLLLADIGARFFSEVPVGVMTALLGGPFFIYLARGGAGRL
jgi:iron complex transport system permease protein